MLLAKGAALRSSDVATAAAAALRVSPTTTADTDSVRLSGEDAASVQQVPRRAFWPSMSKHGVFQLAKLTLNYCAHSGISRGVRCVTRPLACHSRSARTGTRGPC